MPSISIDNNNKIQSEMSGTNNNYTPNQTKQNASNFIRQHNPFGFSTVSANPTKPISFKESAAEYNFHSDMD